VSKNQENVVISDFSPRLALLPIALIDTVTLVENVARLYGLDIILPKIDIFITGAYDRIGVCELLKQFNGDDTNQKSRRIDILQTKIELHFENDPIQPDYIFAGESLGSEHPKGCLSLNDLDFLTSMFQKEVGTEFPIRSPLKPDSDVLDYFARRYFRVPKLKDRQYELLRKIINGESILALLPTAYGKSLIFQLFSLLVPGTTFVISPLSALIRDQIQNLNRLGVICAGSITSEDDKSKKEEKYKGLQKGKYRIFYISPERLRLKDFLKEIRTKLDKVLISALVIDEAHCVSEWGHDFRPPYLQIDNFHKAICNATGREIPIVALTATASKLVREDILKVLGLSDEALIQEESSDRPNISLSVWRAEANSISGKSEMLKKLITKEIPKALGIPFDELIPIEKRSIYVHTGVVFGIYAAPKGSNTKAEGVHFIAREIADDVANNKHLVKVYSSRAPMLCMNCGSPRVISKTQKRGYTFRVKSFECTDCGHIDIKAPDDPSWKDKVLNIQDDFHKSKFPLLVATKGYGMGIDKSNIRFIVHHSFASSLEGYYQEAGRAGRDEDRAHVALIFIPPHKDCESKFRENGRPPCAGLYRCVRPYNLPVQCDYGKQANFIENDYADKMEDLFEILRVYRLMEKNGKIIRYKGRDESDDWYKKTEIALHRLQQLSLVKGYSLSHEGKRRVDFEAEYRNDWIPKEIVMVLKDFATRYKAGIINIDELEKKQCDLTPSANKDEVRGEIFVREAALVLLDHIYNTVPKMRYEMLINQLRYAESDERKECRRIFIRSIFDKVPPDATYRCNFCDICVPDLNFSVSRAVSPTIDPRLEKLALSLPSVLEGFDTEALEEIVSASVDNQAVTGIFAQVTFSLEQRYNNPAALYLAGALSRERNEIEDAMRYLRDGLEFGLAEALSAEKLLAFYHEAKEIDSQEAFSWIIKVDGPWDSIGGLDLLKEEASRLFGKKSPQYRRLSAISRLRNYREILEIIEPFENTISGINALKEVLWLD
jgi:ATP-dependent DNA helicase RecQ